MRACMFGFVSETEPVMMPALDTTTKTPLHRRVSNAQKKLTERNPRARVYALYVCGKAI